MIITCSRGLRGGERPPSQAAGYVVGLIWMIGLEMQAETGFPVFFKVTRARQYNEKLSSACLCCVKCGDWQKLLVIV